MSGKLGRVESYTGRSYTYGLRTSITIYNSLQAKYIYRNIWRKYSLVLYTATDLQLFHYMSRALGFTFLIILFLTKNSFCALWMCRMCRAGIYCCYHLVQAVLKCTFLFALYNSYHIEMNILLSVMLA